MSEETHRLLLVDDHAIVREGIRSLIETEPGLIVAGEVGSAAEALAFIASERVDLVVLDLRMPGMPAAAAVRALLAAMPDLRVLILSSYFVDAEVRAVIEAGASGYILKDACREDIIAAVRAVINSENWIQPSLQGRVIQLLKHEKTGPLLTPREKQVLELLGKGLSNKRIAQELGITEGTVKSYLRQLFPKINATDRLQAALYARGLLAQES